jgi:Ca-activated chloride channel homolog
MKKSLFFISLGVLLTFIFSDIFSVKTHAVGNLRFPVVIASPTVTPSPAPSSAAIKPTPPTLKEEDEIIKVDTELVNLNVRVVDRNNRPINKLQQKDFKIFEDGNLQQIDFFSTSEVPTNYALVVDNSGSIAPQLDKVIEAGKVFIDSNRPGDESMVIRFIGRDKIEILQQFTSSRTDLLDSLDQFYKEGGQSAIIDAVYLAVENVDSYKRSKNSDDKTRRALILVTDGEEKDSFYNEKQLLELLRESEVQIYVIGFVDELSKEGGFISKSPQAKAKALLEKIAAESGGKAYFPANAAELPALAKEISSELRTQYSIGYIPSNEKRDGTYRSIKVSVADGPKAEKRIAITRAGRTADSDRPKSVPASTPVSKPR